MLTQKELKRKIEYNPETGEFFRKLKSGKKLINNRPNKEGYILIGVAGGGVPQQLAHRLAFLYMTGKIPKIVDHINRNTGDNRWCNLRDATPQQNSRNRKSNNKSGYLGVFWSKVAQKWQVQVTGSNEELVYGGLFEYLELDKAVEKANELRLQYHGSRAMVEVFDNTRPLPPIKGLNM